MKAGSGYYEVCLAVIETSTVYYLHQSLCTEVEVLRQEEELEVVEVRVRPGVETARVDWTGWNSTEPVRLTEMIFHSGVFVRKTDCARVGPAGPRHLPALSALPELQPGLGRPQAGHRLHCLSGARPVEGGGGQETLPGGKIR